MQRLVVRPYATSILPALTVRQRLFTSAFIGAVMLFLGLTPSARGSALEESGTPTVTVAPPGAHHFPFLSSALNLGALGYVETEFFFSGTAQAYVNVGAFGADGRWNVAPNPGVTAPYTLRLLVRRPNDPRKFNGTVVVEWFNETAGFDFSVEWNYTHDELLREGYAYVGVTPQYIGAQALQAWEAGQPGNRYATIFHPGDSFAYDIFSQAGRAIAHPRKRGAQPLGALTGKVKTLLATGHSQSGSYLFTYINAVHRLAHVYDGFLVTGAGIGAPLSIFWAGLGDPNQTILGGVPATPFINIAYPAGIRTDQHLPVLMEASELDVLYGVGQTVHNQPDSGTFRLWEVAGSAHFDALADANNTEIQKTYPGSPSITAGCTAPPANTGEPQAYALRAAIHALNRWVTSEEPPTKAPRLSIEVPDPFQVAIIHRDAATGLAIGGIRLPPVAVPVGTLTGDRPPLALDTCFPTLGAYDPWNRDGDVWDGQAGFDPSPTPEPDLQLLYSSHGDYVRRVAASALQSVKSGFMRPYDALTAAQAAITAQVP